IPPNKHEVEDGIPAYLPSIHYPDSSMMLLNSSSQLHDSTHTTTAIITGRSVVTALEDSKRLTLAGEAITPLLDHPLALDDGSQAHSLPEIPSCPRDGIQRISQYAQSTASQPRRDLRGASMRSRHNNNFHVTKSEERTSPEYQCLTNCINVEGTMISPANLSSPLRGTMDTTRSSDARPMVATLGEDVMQLRERFDNLYSHIRVLHLGAELESLWMEWLGFGSTITPLAEWDSISRNYDALLGESRKLATTVASRIKIFREEVIPSYINPNKSLQSQNDRLNRFIQKISEIEKVAEVLGNRFSEIPKRINKFHRLYVEKFRHNSSGIESQVGQLEKQIDELRARARKMSYQTVVRGKTRSSKYGEPMSEALLAVLERPSSQAGHNPLLSTHGFEGGISQTLANPYKEMIHELKETWERLKMLEEQGVKLQHLIPVHVKVHESHAEVICGRLGIIAAICYVLQKEAHTLRDANSDRKGSYAKVEGGGKAEYQTQGIQV
ncbi:unnamed protein product, partial [Rhizoctonia solani]